MNWGILRGNKYYRYIEAYEDVTLDTRSKRTSSILPTAAIAVPVSCTEVPIALTDTSARSL